MTQQTIVVSRFSESNIIDNLYVVNRVSVSEVVIYIFFKLLPIFKDVDIDKS